MRERRINLRGFDAERAIMTAVGNYPARTKTAVMRSASYALLRHCKEGEPPHRRVAMMAASILLVPVWRRLEAAGRITRVDHFSWVITPATLSARI